ncbi:tRNA glutamyl-Q(34) synthetase GluQRS [Methylomonas rhizoryzae]|uniref:tRNA glutamyl-Q(34) synthetase GluQRS n=1 Tax=Methylomonas rhizoryzae TaxID=2608981 RepID=UPI002F96AEBD
MGRFAPSPTGPLHLGSLYTALAGFLDARHHGGQWLLRIDDLDTPRNISGAADDILRCLQRFGLQWDGEVYYQSRHVDAYQRELTGLARHGLLYACRCSRKDLAEHAVYPGYCRDLGLPLEPGTTWRLKTRDRLIAFEDAIQGHFEQNVGLEHGDFVVRRKDDIVAYQCAVVVDDYLQGISHVVRGADLLESTIKQRYLQTLLGYPQPHYRHLPVIVDAQGQKLSKQTLATPVDERNPRQTLFLLLQLLRQDPPSGLNEATLADQLEWAIVHWQPNRLSGLRAVQPETQESPNLGGIQPQTTR